MKKNILLLCLLTSFSFAYAQKANIIKAKNRILQETPDFAGAKELIQSPLADTILNKQADTWYIAGLIGYEQNVKTNQSQNINFVDKGKVIVESYNYFLKAYELDQLPDKKGKIKPKYADIKDKVKEYYSVPANLFAYGVTLYNEKKYAEASDAFDIYLGIPALPMMNNEIPLDSTYYMIMFYNAAAATNAENHEKAIPIYEELLKEGEKPESYDLETVYKILYNAYDQRKDTTNMVRISKEGFAKFPEDAFFLQNLVNYYIATKQSEEALKYLENAIKQNPNSAEYYRVKGNLNEALGNIDESVAAFEKAIELNPNIPEAQAGIGRVIYNKAVKMTDDANDIKDNKKYNAARKIADDEFKKAIPYFEAASRLLPEDMEYKRTLRTLYYRLRMDKEYEALDKEIKAAEGK